MYFDVMMGYVAFDELLLLHVHEIKASAMSKVEERQGIDPLREEDLTVRALDSTLIATAGWNSRKEIG